ncbi:MAG: hypothetical protein ACHQWU_04085 [Gemmatimonadales bacterium]|jgi:protein involved in polysaccharide export with SLBB domain
MSKFTFSVSGPDSLQGGLVESETFRAAVDALGEQVTVHTGDVLEIGVFGFPPARFECVGQLNAGLPMWMPAGLKAA